ncbi:TPA: phage tail protein, partial [Citrobacter koseri]|nr:phage tail protein [Citrobacter koseri]
LTDAKNYQGRLINVQVFTESGKYQKTVGTKKIRVRVQGAGGGGGSASSSSVSNSAFGSGGAAGAYAEVIIDDPGNTETVVIGAGGTAGTSGGSSSFGSFVFCYGGGAGVSDAGGSTQNLLGSGVLGAAPIITGGTKILNISGPNAGDVGIRLGGGMGIAGKGSSSVLSSSGYARITTSPGQSPAGYGAGGNGGGVLTSIGNSIGGAGGGGIIIIEEYA